MIDRLTYRQLQVAQFYADGLTDAQIASTLGVGMETIYSHGKEIRNKLGASNRAHVVALCLRRGLIK